MNKDTQIRRLDTTNFGEEQLWFTKFRCYSTDGKLKNFDIIMILSHVKDISNLF